MSVCERGSSQGKPQTYTHTHLNYGGYVMWNNLTVIKGAAYCVIISKVQFTQDEILNSSYYLLRSTICVLHANLQDFDSR